jgi:hypothetical protein
MKRIVQITLLTLVCLSLTGCDLLEGINQTSPNYRRPVPFSSSWWDTMKIRVKNRELERVKQDWGFNSEKKIWIYAPLLLAMMLMVSCSTVSVTRTPSGALHAGVTSFVGKQTVADATITTREGDTIRINGYSTQNPDPETTKTITNGILINTGINAAQKLAQPVANGVADFIPSNP